MSERIRDHSDALYVPGAEMRGASPSIRYQAFRRGFPTVFSGGAIVEYGSGSATPIQLLLEDGVPFDRAVVTDYTEQRVARLDERFRVEPRVTAELVDIENIPDDFGDFDAAVVIALAMMLVDPVAALRGVREHLKPGGFAWIDVPNVAKLTRRLKLALGRFPATGGRDEMTTFDGKVVDVFGHGHFHYFTWRSMERMLLDLCGYSRVTSFPYPASPLAGPADPWLARRVPSLFSDVCVVAHR